MRHKSVKAHHAPENGSGRRGSAAVELVMVIPLLALLLGLIFTVGSMGISQLEVIIRARHEGWTAARRGVSTSSLDLRSTAGDLAMAAPSKPIVYTVPGLGSLQASASFSALEGSWDHREVLSGAGVHFNDARKIAASNLDSVEALLESYLSDAVNLDSLQNDLAEDLIKSAILSALGVNESDLEIGQRLNEVRAALEGAIEEIASAVTDAIKNLEKHLKDAINPDAVRRKIKALKEAVEDLDDL